MPSGRKDIEEAIESYGAEWDDAPEQGGGGVPAGDYECQVTDVKLGHSQNGRFQCSWVMVVCNGDYVNRKIYKHYGLDTAQSAGWLKGTLKKLDIETVPLADLEQHLQENLVGQFVGVTCKESGDWMNVYVNELLDADSIEVDGLEELTDDGGEEEEEGEVEWEVGNRVVVDFDGEPYAGEITEIDEAEAVATVTFDDESEESIAFADLEAEASDDEDDGEEEEEDDGEEELEEEEDEEPNEAEEEEVVLNFEDAKITKAQQGKLDTIARDNDFDPDEYETYIDLMEELCSYFQITGEFAKSADAVKAITAASTA